MSYAPFLLTWDSVAAQSFPAGRRPRRCPDGSRSQYRLCRIVLPHCDYYRACQPEFRRAILQCPTHCTGNPTGLVMDNYATHKRVEVRDWLAANPRITTHFTPTSGSWLNLVEVWFGIIERQAHPPWQLRLRQRPQRQDPCLHQRLERPPPPIRLDQDR